MEMKRKLRSWRRRKEHKEEYTRVRKNTRSYVKNGRK